jgi:uncharacterized protein (DUF1330 family)
MLAKFGARRNCPLDLSLHRRDHCDPITQGIPMSAYIVFTRERLRVQSEMDIYSGLAGGTLAGHEATAKVVYGKHETLEGAPIDGAVIIEFPTLEAARAWYESPAYAAAREHRFKGADYRVFITEGL